MLLENRRKIQALTAEVQAMTDDPHIDVKH